MKFQDLVNQLIRAGLPADSYTPQTLIEVLLHFMEGLWEEQEDQFSWTGYEINGVTVDWFGWHVDHGFYDWAGYEIEI